MQQGFRREERGLKKDKRAIDQALNESLDALAEDEPVLLVTSE